MLPKRYFAGLTRKQKKERLGEIKRFGALDWKDPRAYVGFKTDTYVKSRTSNYTQRFRRLFPRAKSLKQKADATGVPLRYIRGSYNRGMAAWRTGHRPGATEPNACRLVRAGGGVKTIKHKIDSTHDSMLYIRCFAVYYTTCCSGLRV